MKGHTSTQDGPGIDIGTYHYLLQHFGPLMKVEHVATVLHTTPKGLRMALDRRSHPFTEALANARRRHGRRVYFDSRLVAELINNVHGPMAEGDR
ncbi:MAG: hypothetical protein U5S82_15130 [Gammaproteobacteria bacterium]|nr:hypothetical protein [Gammaproteobacteria bacterium]